MRLAVGGWAHRRRASSAGVGGWWSLFSALKPFPTALACVVVANGRLLLRASSSSKLFVSIHVSVPLVGVVPMRDGVEQRLPLSKYQSPKVANPRSLMHSTKKVLRQKMCVVISCRERLRCRNRLCGLKHSSAVDALCGGKLADKCQE